MIICAALRIHIPDENTQPIIVCGYRHSDCYETLYKLNPKLSKEARKQGLITEGFLSTGNRFIDRYVAYSEAINCGQLSAANREYKHNNHEDMLYSEDLY